MHETIAALITTCRFCVLATVRPDGAPHTSLMACVGADDARRVYFLTSRSTRKYENLQARPRVSLLLDTRQTGDIRTAKALTLTGTCTTTLEGGESKHMHTRLLEAFPALSPLAAHPDATLVAVDIHTGELLDGFNDAHFERYA